MRYFSLFFVYSVLLIFGVFSSSVYAQEKQTLSVTPPLFQLSALPGDVWQSSIKVVNTNAYPLTIYAEVVNFKSTGESGQGKFIPVFGSDEEKATLAGWIRIPKGPFIIAPEQSTDVSFFVEIPKDASPGGHYAAILISTEAPDETEGLAVKTSQAVTSLFFVRIEGDVTEQGTIREFRANDSFLPKPEAEFSLRFENKGNVHLQPRGNIIITNMWGTERGIIPVNYQTHFGNVLPESIRDFKFTWKSDFRMTDIGRYKAEVTLVYGTAGVQNTTAVAHFWIIPVKGTLITITIFGLFVWLIVLMIKAYVRRMLTLAGVDVTREKSETEMEEKEIHRASKASKVKKSYRTVAAPIQSGVLDLRQRLNAREDSENTVTTIMQFVLSYKRFFVFLLLFIGICMSIWLYVSKATELRHDYEVIIDQGDSTTILQGDDIKQKTLEIGQ